MILSDRLYLRRLYDSWHCNREDSPVADKKEKSKGADKKKGDIAAVPFMAYPALDSMREDMERMMQRFFTGDWMANMGRTPMFKDWPRMGAEMPFSSMMNLPRADMSETDGQYELTVELPGLDEKDIELTLSDRDLVLKGEKKAEKESKEKDYHFTERSYGSIRRHFTLPSDVDRDAMKASFTKGVLKVTLPKSKEAKSRSRRIEVSAD
jgi:HSP20 family protein